MQHNRKRRCLTRPAAIMSCDESPPESTEFTEQRKISESAEPSSGSFLLSEPSLFVVRISI